MENGSVGAEREAGATSYGVERLLGLARRRLRLILCSTALAAGLGFVYAATQTPIYRATVELLVDPQALQVVGRDIVRPDTSASIDFANVDSQALVMLSTSVLRGVVDRLRLEADPAFQPHPGRLARLFGSDAPALDPAQRAEAALDLLRQAVVIHRVDNSLVFQITVSDADARRAAAIANALAQSYLKQVASERISAVDRSNASLLSQVSDLRRQLDDAEAAAERFRADNGLIRSSDTGLVVTQQLKDLYTQIDAANAEVARLAARKEQLAKAGPEALLTDTVPEALNSATVTALRSAYAQTARELASLGQTLLPQHPRVLEVKAELAETQSLLKAELVRIRGSVATAYAQAVDNLAKLQARAKELTRDKVASSEAEIRLRRLESEAEAIRSVYNASLSRVRELDQQGKIATSNSRVLSEAAPPLKASKPPLALVVAAAALFGASLGLGIGFLLDLVPPRRRAARPVRDAAASVAPEPGPPPPWTPTTLDAVTRTLRQRLGKALPAVVAVVGVPDPKPAAALAVGLAEALVEAGEEVLLCEGGTADDMRARLLAPRPGAAAGLMAAARTATRGAWTAARLGARGEFVVVAAGTPGLPAGTAAIVFAIDPSRASADAVAVAMQRFDPERRLGVGVVASRTAGRERRRGLAA